MNISPISFAGTSVNFNEHIKAPQTFPKQEVAATNLNKPQHKSSALKTIGKVALVMAAVVAGIAVGAKHIDKIQNETVKKYLGYLQTAGEKVSEFTKTNFDKIKKFVIEHKPSKNKVPEAVQDAVKI